MLIDAVTHRRIDVLPDRKSATLITWLRAHPGVQVVCRDGSAAYAEAIRQGAPDAVQVSDRWHLWHGLAAAVEKTVVTHSRCWHTAGPHRTGTLAERTRRKHAQVHTLLDQGLGLGECARRLAGDSTRSNARPAPPRRTISCAHRGMAPRWSTPPPSTCDAVWPKSPACRSPICWPKSASAATPAAPTCCCSITSSSRSCVQDAVWGS
ncbi:ISL3 family transposase, partial [Sphaerisporangium flaviroseum]|uniref:ISL3 family transposase n=1 Tax=Sphaerisporangium flaviroseum TaxID=509199 RepID=UPI003CD0AFAE